jgi:sigma-B regulation protein RsbU (phosphoserine phosphatase)
LELIMGEGVPLGVLEEMPYESTRHPFEVGDQLILLTDGLYEVENPAGQMLGRDELTRQITRLAGQSPEAVCHSVLAWVEEYSGSPLASDDRTILVVECLEESS